MTNIGDDFERDLSKLFGLSRVPGSGNQWHSKLDLHGMGARWSLKATNRNSISISRSVIEEAVSACLGTGGDGSIPVWAFRIGSEDCDIVALRKSDFVSLQRGDLRLVVSEDNEKSAQKRERAKTPILLRDEDGD